VDPGEGERRAATGYFPQYRIAAELTIAHIRALEWLKVADPSAGAADDFQLAVISGTIHALQVKWSGFASPFTFRDLTGGKTPLIGQLAQAWERIRSANPERLVRIHLVSNDYASTSDAVRTPVSGTADHFAAFIVRGLGLARAAFERGPVPDINLESYVEEWKEAWETLRSASGLDEAPFWEFISDFDLNLAVGADAFPELSRATPAHRNDVAELADFLFGCVADPAHIVRLTQAELLEQLGWTRRLTFRSQHIFPVSTAYQPNQAAVDDLLRVIETNAGGYLALAAPAGAGKSSLLTATTLPARRTVYYYAYTPASPDPSTGRGESENFFFDLVSALDAAGLHTGDVIDPRDRLANKDRLLRQLELAGQDWEQDGIRTIIVIDGLDHIPREQNPSRSLIDDLPLPVQIPDGVFVILGTQVLDILPVAVRSSLEDVDRIVSVPPLADVTVLAIATAAGPGQWLQPEQKQRLVAMTEGHPLALTYLLEQLSDISFDVDSPGRAWSAADSVLEEGAAYRGSVLARYEGYWQRVDDPSVHHLLAVAARIRSPIHLDWLRTWNAPESVRRFADSTAPFFVKDGHSWSFIHNSFRQYLIDRTATLGGAFDPYENRRMHAEAAEICASSTGTWVAYRDEELAQRVHAEQHSEVLELATPELLCQRLLNLAPPAAIALDAQLALQSAGALCDPPAVLRLALMQFELELRQSVLEPHALALALIDIGEYDLALPHVIGGRELRLDPDHALEAAVRFHSANRIADAGAIIRSVGSLSVLLETSRHGDFYDQKTADSIQWWVAVHSRVRPAVEVLQEIESALSISSGSQSDNRNEDDGQEEHSLISYRTVALLQLAASMPHGDTDRPRVISALAEVDPVATAVRELDSDGGISPDEVLKRIDSALVQLGVAADPDPAMRWPDDTLQPVPIHVRIKAAELLLRSGGSREMIRRLVEGCETPSSDVIALDRTRDIWLGYRLQRLRFFLGMPARRTPSRRADSEDLAVKMFTSALDELAELEASVWRWRLGESAGYGPIMAVARRLHRLYEIPLRDRRRWTSWYAVAGAAPKVFSTLISIAAAANHEVVGELQQLFVSAWTDKARSQYWSQSTRIAVLRAFAQAGAGEDSIRADLSDVRRAISAEVLDAHSRVEALLQISGLFSLLGASSAAHGAVIEAVAASLVPGAHDGENQLSEWVERLGDVLSLRPIDTETNRATVVTMARRLAHAVTAGASTETPATNLIRLAFSTDPGLAADLAAWFSQYGVLSGPEGLAGLLGGAADDPEVPAWLAADVTRSIYMPAAIPALYSMASKLVDRGGEPVRAILADGVRRWVLPSFRDHWGSAIADDAEASSIPYIGEPPSPSDGAESGTEETVIHLTNGDVLNPEVAGGMVSSPAELMELFGRVAPAGGWRKNPLGLAVARVAKDVAHRDLPALLTELERLGADAESYAALAIAQASGDRTSTRLVVDAAMRSISMRGWSSWWDGGTRRKFWADLVDVDDAFRDWAVDDLATALRVNAIQLSGLVHDLHSILPIIGLDACESWKVFDPYLDVLCRPMGGAANFDPPPSGDSGARSLMRVVASFAGHPVRTLEWGARNVMRRALQHPDTADDAVMVISAACTASASSAEAMLGAAASAAPLPEQVSNLLAAPVREAERVHDQIVRDVAQYAAERLGVPYERSVRRPLPLTYSLTVPPIPSRSDPIIDDEGVAVLDPTNPRAVLGTYDTLLDDRLSRLSELGENVLIRQAARFAFETAEHDEWTIGGVGHHAARLKKSGWLHGYRPWALMAGRRGAAAVLADLVDARVMPDPTPVTVSIRLGLLDPALDLAEPEAKPAWVSRPARRGRFGASVDHWIGDTLDAARIYANTNPRERVLGQWADWTEFSWERASERRISVVDRVRSPVLGDSARVFEIQQGALRATEGLMHLGAFDSAAEYYAAAAQLARDDPPELSEVSAIVGGREWWAEARTGTWLALDPLLGVALGWKLDPDGLFRWTDDSDSPMAWSRWWIQCLDTHQPPHFDDDAGEGWQVLTSEAGWAAIFQSLGPLELRLAVARSGKRRDMGWEAEAMGWEAEAIAVEPIESCEDFV